MKLDQGNEIIEIIKRNQEMVKSKLYSLSADVLDHIKSRTITNLKTIGIQQLFFHSGICNYNSIVHC